MPSACSPIRAKSGGLHWAGNGAGENVQNPPNLPYSYMHLQGQQVKNGQNGGQNAGKNAKNGQKIGLKMIGKVQLEKW